MCLFYIAVYHIQSIAQKMPDTISSSKPLYIVQKHFYNVEIDRTLSMRAGSANIILAHKGLSILEDSLLKTKWFDETNFIKKTQGVLFRLTKYVLLDLPIDYFAVVLAHEYFGHGARYREFKFSPIDYGFDLPPPYGAGGGYASLNLSEPINYNKHLAIWKGGMEIHNIINRKLALNWITMNRMNYREASIYFWSFQILNNYISGTKEDLGDGEKDNDPRAYVRILNNSAGYPDVNNLKLDVADLKSKTRINAFNPFVYYSMYTLLKTYIWQGKTYNKLLTINLGGIRYLPVIRTGLSPFGVEYHIENYISFNTKGMLIDYSFGDKSFTEPWMGLGIIAPDLYTRHNLSVDFNANLWNQPKLDLSKNAVYTEKKEWGIAISSRAYYTFKSSKIPVHPFVEIGYKTKGFVEGYDLNASIILSGGLGILL